MVTMGFFSSNMGESKDLVTEAHASDTTRDIGRLGEDLGVNEDTVFCGLCDVEDTGELVVDVLVLGVLGEFDDKLSARSLSWPAGPPWLSKWSTLLDPGEEAGFVESGCLIPAATSEMGVWVPVLGSPDGRFSGGLGAWIPSWRSGACACI